MTTPDRSALLDAMSARGGKKKQVAKVQILRSERSARTTPSPLRRQEKYLADELLNYELRDETHPDVVSGVRKQDDPLVLLLKDKLNTSGLTRRDLYQFIGDGPGSLFENKNQVYNLEYGLRERPTITTSCAQRWLATMGLELDIVFQPIGSNLMQRLLDLRQVVLEGKSPEELQAMARSIPVEDGSQ